VAMAVSLNVVVLTMIGKHSGGASRGHPHTEAAVTMAA
jgi:hypothetical protein